VLAVWHISSHMVAQQGLCLLQLLDEFVEAVMSRWPKTVLQFEDFQLQYAHALLQRYKNQHLVFNDDIQVGSHTLLLQYKNQHLVFNNDIQVALHCCSATRTNIWSSTMTSR